MVRVEEMKLRYGMFGGVPENMVVTEDAIFLKPSAVESISIETTGFWGNRERHMLMEVNPDTPIPPSYWSPYSEGLIELHGDQPDLVWPVGTKFTRSLFVPVPSDCKALVFLAPNSNCYMAGRDIVIDISSTLEANPQTLSEFDSTNPLEVIYLTSSAPIDMPSPIGEVANHVPALEES